MDILKEKRGYQREYKTTDKNVKKEGRRRSRKDNEEQLLETSALLDLIRHGHGAGIQLGWAGGPRSAIIELSQLGYHHQ